MSQLTREEFDEKLCLLFNWLTGINTSDFAKEAFRLAVGGIGEKFNRIQISDKAGDAQP